MRKFSIESIRKAAKGERGFTLIELLVTVTVIGILAAVVSVGVGGASTAAQTKANVGTFNQVQAAVDSYNASGTSPALQSGTDAATTGAAWYSKTGVTIAPVPGDKLVVLSSLTGGAWLRLYNNTTLECFFDQGTSTVRGCRNAP